MLQIIDDDYGIQTIWAESSTTCRNRSFTTVGISRYHYGAIYTHYRPVGISRTDSDDAGRTPGEDKNRGWNSAIHPGDSFFNLE